MGYESDSSDVKDDANTIPTSPLTTYESHSRLTQGASNIYQQLAHYMSTAGFSADDYVGSTISTEHLERLSPICSNFKRDPQENFRQPDLLHVSLQV